jgi:Peptidase family S41
MAIHFIEPLHLKHPENKDPKPRFEPKLEDLEKMNYSFGCITLDTDSVAGKTIATLPIDSFLPSTEKSVEIWKEIRAGIGEKLSSIADADALIVDLRENHGGDPSTVAFIMSYLLQDGPRHLLDFVDRSGEVQQSFSTLPIDELPAGTRAFGGTKPLFVLTSKDTISGGEDMAYGLQAFNRAIAIVGERNEATAGAANPNTKPHFLCEEEFGDKWWLAGIPTSKPIHSITLSNWEGIGVRSDVLAGKGEWIGVDDAKEVATRLAMRVLGHGKNEL